MRDGYPTMDQRFLEAFLTPSRTRLLGYDLFPWCLKHRLQLTALGNPMLTNGQIGAGDLIIFAKVCSERPLAPTFRDRLTALLMSRGKGRGFAEAIEAARDHMRLSAWPKFWDPPKTEGGEPRNSGMPWVLAVLTNLVRSGLTLEEAMHLPECQAIWLSSAFGIQQGGKLEFLTSDDEALLDHLSTLEKPKNEPQPTV